MEAFDAATVIWDLSHSAGRGPGRAERPRHPLRRRLHLQVPQRGPGRGRLPLRRRPGRRCGTPIQGWFGQDDQFAMERPYAPAPGIARFMAGTPPILVLAAVEEGVRITAEAGIEALREKSIAQSELMIALHDEWLTPLGFTLGSPRDPHAARLARLAQPPRGVADLPRADRARGRRPRLPRPGQRAARHRAALHPLRRRLGRDRPAARTWSSAASSARSIRRARASLRPGHRLLGAPLHLLLGHVLGVRGEHPAVAVRVLQRARAVAVELVGGRG